MKHSLSLITIINVAHRGPLLDSVYVQYLVCYLNTHPLNEFAGGAFFSLNIHD